jgi:hypothetical protein
MAKQPYKTFAGLKTEIRQEVWPGASAGTSNEAENLIQAHDAHFIEGIAEIQRECPGLRHFQTNVVSFEKTFFKGAMTCIAAPNGVVTRIYTVDRNWFQPIYYVQQRWPEPEMWGLANRKSLAAALNTQKPLPLGFMHASAEHDRKTGRARGGIWAIDPQTRNICIAPWIHSEETLVIEWSGVKNASEWSDQDPVPDWPDFKRVLKLYIQWAHERDFGSTVQARTLHNDEYTGTYDMALADLILWDREINRVHSEQGEAINRQHRHHFMQGFGNFPQDITDDWPAKCQPPALIRAPGAPPQPGDSDSD